MRVNSRIFVLCSGERAASLSPKKKKKKTLPEPNIYAFENPAAGALFKTRAYNKNDLTCTAATRVNRVVCAYILLIYDGQIIIILFRKPKGEGKGGKDNRQVRPRAADRVQIAETL